MALHHNPRIVTSGLVLALDAGDINSYPGSGTTWYDVSGNSNNFTVYGSPTFSRGSGFTFVNGSTSVYAIANPFPFPTTALTIELWYKTTTPSTGILSYAVSGNDNHALLFSPQNVALYGPTGVNFSGVNTANGTWNHVVRTSQRSSGAEILYVNGVNSYTVTMDAGINFTTGGSLVLGQEQDGVGGGFDSAQAFGGNIPVVRLYNRVLTPAEVLQNYNTTKGRFGL